MIRRKPLPIRIDGDVAYIPLTQGLEGIIDTADVPLVENSIWHAVHHGESLRYVYGRVEGRQALLHRYLMQTPKKMCVDHINRNGLDNRRSNLRNCTHRENMVNKTWMKTNKLQLKGVEFVRGRFRVTIKPDGKTIFLGSYDTKEEASAAYFGAARALWGKFASL